jgi:DnaK suppressor protein
MPSKPAKKTGGSSRKKAAARTGKKKPSRSKSASAAKTAESKEAMLRRMLQAKRQELLRKAQEEVSKYIKGENRQLVETALDDGDWSVIDVVEDITLKQLSVQRQTIVKVEEALRKLDDKTYGTCEECGEDINPERLKILPFAILCRDCQEEREKLEEASREEIPFK